jgi:hypothetical protein
MAESNKINNTNKTVAERLASGPSYSAMIILSVKLATPGQLRRRLDNTIRILEESRLTSNSLK